MSVARQTFTLELPAGFRAADILKFHQRDAQGLAEWVEADALHKGLLWDGRAACLSVRFRPGQAEVEIAIDGPSAAVPGSSLTNQVRRLLGLTQSVELFEQTYRQHPQLGPLLARQAGLRVPLAATPFEALTWAITGQQISVGAAVSMRRKLIKAAGVVHSGGLACYPDAERLAALDESDLRAAGFSQSKAQTLQLVSQLVLSGELPLAEWQEALPVEAMRQRLLAVRGIGPWTVNYTLLRGFGWLDGSLHGDVAVRRALQRLLAAPEKIGEAAARDWLEPFSPWRALVGAHLWASLALSA
ncbi:DNA-3-methyladenine glycosylase family protein [Dechloromonas denitrificans]|uniref:DNA-3-methyladenine glycosylase family protein n=1 Tax=Dechloromonas denitrificans TaxID=281362 RepID=UPI001CF98713|nr:AlkA N-terminal domain-containing protein [Dechloromonas denitrificans]UCV06568.1 3-methyladenine DNA glycosylase 2 [Dechloromonas denitrificans]